MSEQHGHINCLYIITDHSERKKENQTIEVIYQIIITLCQLKSLHVVIVLKVLYLTNGHSKDNRTLNQNI